MKRIRSSSQRKFFLLAPDVLPSLVGWWHALGPGPASRSHCAWPEARSQRRSAPASKTIHEDNVALGHDPRSAGRGAHRFACAAARLRSASSAALPFSLFGFSPFCLPLGVGSPAAWSRRYSVSALRLRSGPVPYSAAARSSLVAITALLVAFLRACRGPSPGSGSRSCRVVRAQPPNLANGPLRLPPGAERRKSSVPGRTRGRSRNFVAGRFTGRILHSGSSMSAGPVCHAGTHGCGPAALAGDVARAANRRPARSRVGSRLPPLPACAAGGASS